MLEEYSGTDRSIRKVTDVLNIIEILKADKRIKTTDKIIYRQYRFGFYIIELNEQSDFPDC